MMPNQPKSKNPIVKFEDAAAKEELCEVAERHGVSVSAVASAVLARLRGSYDECYREHVIDRVTRA